MPRPSNIACLLLLVTVSFWAGARLGGRRAADASRGAGEVLRYACPMHPRFTSDRPGDAPCCGMRLEPVYAGEPAVRDVAGEPGTGLPPPPGTVRISAERQQLVGVQLGTVQQTSDARKIRLSGRVAADERRIYIVNAATEGWIRQTFSDTTGGLVRKDELLATYYAPEFHGAEQAYIYALDAMHRFQAAGRETSDQIALTKVSVQQAADGLRNLGMGEVQIRELERTRTITKNIELRSPETGFVLERKISPGLRFDRGTELYRIADLSNVWILADAFDNEPRYFQPGARARVSLPRVSRSFPAVVSSVPPQFDPSSRTLKIRLECPNPGYLLRPDMFVDVELAVNPGPAITVNRDAVIHSGLTKSVFVARAGGYFEPRCVETGESYGDRIEILAGLTPGEQIVVSGTFLVDSESRMRAGADLGMRREERLDIVCGMKVDEDEARGAGRTADHEGTTYFFCSEACQRSFRKDPSRYLKGNLPGRVVAAAHPEF